MYHSLGLIDWLQHPVPTLLSDNKLKVIGGIHYDPTVRIQGHMLMLTHIHTISVHSHPLDMKLKMKHDVQGTAGTGTAGFHVHKELNVGVKLL